MADTVNYHLERMLPELQDLHKRALFSRAEIKEIVKRRRNFEYLLKRHSVLKQDFLSYVQYEQQLEALRKLRKKVLVRALKAAGQRWRPSLSDRSSVIRIMLIFERAVTRFKGDLNIWLRYLEFCRKNGPRRLQKVMTKALQLHSAVPGLWMYAAAWEFEHNLNVNAARVLMQTGLRMCPHSQSLWHEYFRMELTYAHKIKARRLVLGLHSEDESTEDNKSDLELSYKVALTIFRNAILAIPSSIPFRLQFFHLLQAVDLDQAHMLDGEICNTLAADFPEDEASWDWRARRFLRVPTKRGFSECMKSVVEVYEDALKAVPSLLMYELFAKVIEEFMDPDDSGWELDSAPRAKVVATEEYELAAEMQLQVFERAAKSGFQSEFLAERHIALLLRWGKLEQARHLAAQLCASNSPPSAKLWHLRLSMEVKWPSSAGAERSELANLFCQALKSIPLGEAKPTWHMAMEYFSRQENQFGMLLDILETALASGRSAEAGADVACVLVDWIQTFQGIERARQAYNSLLALPGPSVELIRHAIALESRTASSGDSVAFQQMRKLFDLGVKLYGKDDSELWLEYCLEELQAGNTEAAGAVYWRAKRALRDPATFVEAHQKATL